jgi:predicted ATPase
VTLTGTGGCGKTQLALHVSADLVDAFRDGVWLVELATVQTPHLVPYAVAAVLGRHDRAGEAMIDTIVAYLRRRELLLVLDNCEHLIDACADLAERVLCGCPEVRLLATSRERLRLGAETTWRVPSLANPDRRTRVTPVELLAYPAVRLFVERAQAIESGFALGPNNASTVVDICACLEGLPLALELAAAHVSALSLSQILERLDDTFRMLVGGSRTAPTRHQTLRATLDWSIGLLTAAEQAVFRRLAVFAGGWSLEAAETVCADATIAPADVLTSLRVWSTSLWWWPTFTCQTDARATVCSSRSDSTHMSGWWPAVSSQRCAPVTPRSSWSTPRRSSAM